MAYIDRIGLPFRHTGNSMNYQEMDVFNRSIDLQELRNYRREVGARSRECIRL